MSNTAVTNTNATSNKNFLCLNWQQDSSFQYVTFYNFCLISKDRALVIRKLNRDITVFLDSATTMITTTSVNLPAECYTYTPTNDLTRLSTYTGGLGDDAVSFTIAGVEYRFVGSSGTNLAQSATSLYGCGGYYTGWYSGTMPTYGNTVSGTVCFVMSSNCTYISMISLTNCGSYNVYDLAPAPITYGRYCTI